jgi:hypothetical protein
MIMQVQKDSQIVNVSIILVSYNSFNDLAECIPSILRQTYRDFEIIIVDNSTNDESTEYFKNEFLGVRYIKSASNGGYSEGNNIGMQYAKGKYIVIVNPDTVVDDNWLVQLIKPLEDHEEIAITTSKILLYDNPNKINTFSNCSHFTGLDFCKGLWEPADRYSKSEETSVISGCSFAIRRLIFEELGGFDTDFFLYLEDIDLSWRARLAGYRIIAIPESIVFHKFNLFITPRKEFYLERNRYQMLLKDYSLKTLILLLPALMVTEGMTWGHAIIQGLPYVWNKLRSYGWVIANINIIMRKRYRVQKSRKISDRELIKFLEWRIPFEQVIKNKFAGHIISTIFNSFYLVYYKIITALL